MGKERAWAREFFKRVNSPFTKREFECSLGDAKTQVHRETIEESQTSGVQEDFMYKP